MRNKCQTERRTTCSELKGMAVGWQTVTSTSELREQEGTHSTGRRDGAPRCEATFLMCSEWAVPNSLLNDLQWAGLCHNEQEQILNNATFSGTGLCCFISTLNQCSSLHESLLCISVSWSFSLFFPLRTQNNFSVTTLLSLVNA